MLFHRDIVYQLIGLYPKVPKIKVGPKVVFSLKKQHHNKTKFVHLLINYYSAFLKKRNSSFSFKAQVTFVYLDFLKI